VVKVHVFGSLGAILSLTGPADAFGTVDVPDSLALFASFVGLVMVAAALVSMRRARAKATP
jgi:hypothetical protein